MSSIVFLKRFAFRQRGWASKNRPRAVARAVRAGDGRPLTGLDFLGAGPHW